MHVLKPARLQVYSFWHSAWRSGRVGQALSRCYSHLSAAFLLFCCFFYFLLGKKPPPPSSFTCFFLSGCINLLLPFPVTCTFFLGILIPLSLHAKMQKKKFFFYLLQAYFFSFKQFISETFFTSFFEYPPPPLPKKKKKGEGKKRKRSKSMVHGGNESTTWLMLCPNPRQRKCSCSAKTQIWRLCSRKPKS